MVELKECSTPIGMCGIIRRDSLEYPDIGFAILPDHYGKGYGYEIADATLLFAKEKLMLPSICAITLPDNIPSIRLIEKLGMKFEKNLQMNGEVLQLYYSR
jgi:RimJ/RimL family protein N-acetyltransferase